MFHPVKKEVSNKTIRLPDTLLEKMELLAVQKDVSFVELQKERKYGHRA